MKDGHPETQAVDHDGYQGELCARLDPREVIAGLEGAFREEGVSTATFTLAGAPVTVSVKTFTSRGILRDRVEQRQGSRARRHWTVARRLAGAGVGTPEPLGFLERWEDGRLGAAHLLVRHVSAESFKDRLIHHYTEDPDGGRLISLLQRVADALRALHAAGVRHGDLGNQNILLAPGPGGEGEQVVFIDLNRARFVDAVGPRHAAFDLSRIYLPSDLLRIFAEMYWEGPRPERFARWEKHYRRRFNWHTRTRRWRHPVRERRRAAEARDEPVYPDERDIWIWDDRSAQAMTLHRSRERNRLAPPRSHVEVVRGILRHAIPVARAYRELKAQAFHGPVEMAGRVGMSIQASAETFEREREALEPLGRLPLWVRFYSHETPKEWSHAAEAVARLGEDGFPVSIALVQDRRAVRDPHRWRGFVKTVLDGVGNHVEYIEVAHALNRVKWGIWRFDEYSRLAAAVAAEAARFPGARLLGPAAIDFEYHYVPAAALALDPGTRFHGLSHLLYVDRRGAPENRQGGFTTMEKCALGRALARALPPFDDRFIITEVNWPLAGTGVYSPVGSPYLYPGQRVGHPSVDETTYGNYMIRYLLHALCSGMTDRVYWWRLAAHGFGLIDDAGPAWRPRPAYHMMRVFLEQVGAARFAGLERNAEGLHRFHFLKPDGGKVTIAYTTGHETGFRPEEDVETVLDATGREQKSERVQLTGTPVYLVSRRSQV